jgi:hypothetical protein
MLQRNIAGSDYEKAKMEFLAFIRARGEKGVMKKELGKLKPFSVQDKRKRMEMLKDLQDSGLVGFVQSSGGKRGRPAYRYVAIETD